MEVGQLLSLLPDDTLEKLAFETNVNKFTKKLHGEVVFKLLIHCILSFKDNSLRTMESAYESIGFKLLNAKVKSESIRFSSISERLSVIEPVYFEKLYNKCIEKYSHILQPRKTELIRFDSTIVSLSSKLLRVGYHIPGGDAAHLNQLKFTIGLTNLPVAVHFFTEQIYTSENEALKEAVVAFEKSNRGIINVFDRGITARKTYDGFTEGNIPFVSRIGLKSRKKVAVENELSAPVTTSTLNILSDSWVYLFNSNKAKTKYPVRCIEASRKETGESIIFISNIRELSAEEITILYKQRWDIEVFFKFIKQELNFDHLINRSENGIKVMLYCTMIAAILLITYKELNGIKGYKIMKQRFVHDLEKSLMKDFVILCGGNPDLVDKHLKIAPE
jgi:hypothetical protein